VAQAGRPSAIRPLAAPRLRLGRITGHAAQSQAGKQEAGSQQRDPTGVEAGPRKARRGAGRQGAGLRVGRLPMEVDRRVPVGGSNAGGVVARIRRPDVRRALSRSLSDAASGAAPGRRRNEIAGVAAVRLEPGGTDGREDVAVRTQVTERRGGAGRRRLRCAGARRRGLLGHRDGRLLGGGLCRGSRCRAGLRCGGRGCGGRGCGGRGRSRGRGACGRGCDGRGQGGGSGVLRGTHLSRRGHEEHREGEQRRKQRH